MLAGHVMRDSSFVGVEELTVPLVTLDPLMQRVIGCAIEVHRTLGPGLLERTYGHCLAYELAQQRIRYREQVQIPVQYKRMHVACGYRLDLVIDDRIILELKTVERFAPVHRAQLLTYLRMTGITTGYLMNFNVPRLVDDIRRVLL